MDEIGFYPANKRSKTSIDIIIRYFGKRYKVPSGISVEKKYWNAKKHRVSETVQYKDCYYINSRLNSIDSIVRAELHNIALKMIVPTQSELSALIKPKIKPNAVKGSNEFFVQYIEHFIENVNRSKNTKKRYITTKNNLAEYETEYRVKLTFGDIDMKFYNKLQHWFEKHDQSLNYFGDAIKNIKVFFQAAHEEGLHSLALPKSFKTLSEDSDSIYLTNDELLRLHKLVINEDLILDAINEKIIDAKILNVKGNIERMIFSLRNCRDVFLIGAYTAMRYSDYAFLKGLKHTDSYISRISEKTSTKTVIPMHPIIRDILKSHNNAIPKATSNQKLNKQLKMLARLAGIKDNIETTITKGGLKKRQAFEKWELVTTHTARRSGATNMFLAGIDTISIMKFSGHTTVKSFMKYIKASPQETAERLKDHPYFK